MKYFLFDPTMNSGAGAYMRATSLKPAADIQHAKCYKLRGAAINAASLWNVSRNVPPGLVFVASHDAPPTYLNVDVEGDKVVSITPVTL